MSQAMTLGDLLTRQGRDLRLVAGEDDATKRPVRGVHSTEMDHPTLWVERDWVVLTSGLALRRRPDKQKDLIAELDEAGVTALGFGIGSAFSVAPKGLVAEARKRTFPVFVIPWDVSFRDMIRDVYQGLLSDDVRGYLRLASMQHHLLDALADEAPQDTVLERLASLVGGNVAVLGVGGQVLRATGRFPAAECWQQLSERSPMVAEFDAVGWHFVGVPLPESAETPERWLIVASEDQHLASALTKRVAQITAPLLSAMAKIDEVARDQERQTRASLLRTLLEPTANVDAGTLMARARAVGIQLDGASRVLAIDQAGAGAEQGALAVLESATTAIGITSLLAERDGVAIMLAEPPEDGAWEAVLEELGQKVKGYSIGVGRPVDTVADVHQSYADALLALRRAQASGNGAAVTYEQLDLDAWLVAEVPAERWTAKVEAFVAPLMDNEPLRETVAAYFANDLDVIRTAEALHLHPNSLRYRLRRVEKLIGRPLRSPSTVAAIQLALLTLGDDLGAEHRSPSPPAEKSEITG